MKLLVRNLNRNTTEAEIKLLFEKHGAVQSCHLIMDVNTGLSKGFGFVEMPKQGEAKAAMKTLNGSSLAENVIRVKKASPKQEQSPESVLDTSERRSGSKDKLHGVTLEMIVTSLVEAYGWSELGKRISIKCFTHEPSIGSSLSFLRKTLWAREKVELLYLRLNEHDQTRNSKKLATENPITEKPATEKPATEKSTMEQPVAEKPTFKKLNSKVLTADKTEAEKLDSPRSSNAQTSDLKFDVLPTKQKQSPYQQSVDKSNTDIKSTDDKEKPQQLADKDKSVENKAAVKKPVKKNPWGTIIEEED